MFTGAALGFFAPSLREAPWSGDFAAISGNPAASMWANGLILAAAIITTFGLVALSLRFEGPSRTWAWMGLVAFAFAALLSVIDRIMSVWLTTRAAQQGLEEADVIVQAFSRFDDGLGFLFFILGFLSLSLYGLAMAQTDRHNGLGWLFVAVGIVGIVLGSFGAGIPAMPYFGTAALGIATWRFGVPPRTTD